MRKTPFFSRFVERQSPLEIKTDMRAGATLKYPSDRDENITLKYPSDDDEYTGPITK